MNNENIKDTVFNDSPDLYNKRIVTVPKPDPQIGIDLENNLYQNITASLDNGISSTFDVNSLNSFTNVSRSRNEIYQTLDYMAEDSIIAAALETYAEDATETNDNGDIVWVESSDSEAAKYISFLLKSLCVNKHIYGWAHSLIKYGDVYLRLYRESEYDDNLFKPKPKLIENDKSSNERTMLNEDVNIRAYSKQDKYVHYLEQVSNPAQMFELTRFGKTAGFIKTSVDATTTSRDAAITNSFLTKYQFNSSDVDLYPPTEFVHGCLQDNSSRSPEEVELFTVTDENNEQKTYSYTVKRGQSILYSNFKIWRQLNLLENSVLLNRVTQSSIVRMINVEVGEMAKESVGPHLAGIKQLIEQKTALDVGKSINEYTNPGPMINNVYVPTRNGQGAISTTQIGGDVDVRGLADLEYYQDKFYGALRIPKAYFGVTDDGAGFNGGQSLSIISSRYAKAIKRIQNTLIQMLTDAINLILIDTHNENYINNFKLKMLPPTTQEEVDRRDNLVNKVGLVRDIMDILSDVENTTTRLKILQSLLSSTITDSDVVQLLQEEVEKLEQEATQPPMENTDDIESSDSEDIGSLLGSDFNDDISNDSVNDMLSDETPEEESEEEDDELPSPDDLDIGDLSDSTNPNLD